MRCSGHRAERRPLRSLSLRRLLARVQAPLARVQAPLARVQAPLARVQAPLARPLLAVLVQPLERQWARAPTVRQRDQQRARWKRGTESRVRTPPRSMSIDACRFTTKEKRNR
jgi:hypothetical protein